MPIGTVAVTLSKVSPAATGLVSLHGPVGVTLPAIAPAAAGWTTITGTAAVTLKPMAPALVAGSGPAGTVALTLPKINLAAAGWNIISGTTAVTLSKTTSAATGKTGIQGTMAAVLAKVAHALTGYTTAESNVIEGEPELGLAVNNRGAATSYTIDHSDRERLVVFAASAPVAVTLPQAIGAFGNGFIFRAFNLGAGVVTITATTSTINGLTDAVSLVTLDNVVFISDGQNWYAVESNYS